MTTDTTTLVQTTAKVTAEEIVAKVNAKLGQTQAAALAPVLAQYAPAFAAMSAAEIWAWIDLATKGDEAKAFAAIVVKMQNPELINEWSALNTKWQTANEANAVAIAWQREAVAAVLKALVTIAASLVVL